MILDLLQEQLFRLAAELRVHNVKLILGGGYGLFQFVLDIKLIVHA
jgi:hypothetical protein